MMIGVAWPFSARFSHNHGVVTQRNRTTGHADRLGSGRVGGQFGRPVPDRMPRADIHEEASVKTKEQDEHGTTQTSLRHQPRKRSAMRDYAVAPLHTSGVALRQVGPRDAT